MMFGGMDFGGGLGHEDGGMVNEISDLIKETSEFIVPSIMMT